MNMQSATPGVKVVNPDAFPLLYCMLLNSPCAVEGWEPGTPLAFTQLDQPNGGDAAILYIKGRDPVLIRLVTDILPEDWQALPDHRMTAGSDVDAAVVCDVLGTDRTVSVRLERVTAIHKCLGPVKRLTGRSA
ncbi:hypothetical protein LGR54_04340 [Ancylobacter sp. Lp-2]|uniref:hypothetical protein n=1 Tax=Ancylobacter sp. Lp-2 TaxID=2881339 RepID=UPI001E5FFC98|nr:hypothetical protein [Ancylobacter sp. Lp-2]MCB4767823.1 hypothetical protein [Ancylobacter sp. Lp-2]